MRPINSLVERYIPSALVFVIVLTAIVVILAVALTGATAVDVIRDWGNGLSGLLAFMTQMALILLLGHALANTAPVKRLLALLASIPKNPVQAYVFVCVIAAFASLITWGLGLVVGWWAACWPRKSPGRCATRACGCIFRCWSRPAIPVTWCGTWDIPVPGR
jgi:short-chain fatty acids transporter